MRFPNLVWAIARWGPRYRFADALQQSESWLSRRLSGRYEFSPQDRSQIAAQLQYPQDWLFLEPQPPTQILRK